MCVVAEFSRCIQLVSCVLFSLIHIQRRAQSLTDLDGSDSHCSTAENPHMQELEVKLTETLRYCYEDCGNAWTAVHEDGDMKVGLNGFRYY